MAPQRLLLAVGSVNGQMLPKAVRVCSGLERRDGRVRLAALNSEIFHHLPASVRLLPEDGQVGAHAVLRLFGLRVRISDFERAAAVARRSSPRISLQCAGGHSAVPKTNDCDFRESSADVAKRNRGTNRLSAEDSRCGRVERSRLIGTVSRLCGSRAPYT
jgi:hypothetical protein